MKRFIFFFSFVFFSFIFSSSLELKTCAKSAILMNLDTGKILYQKNPHMRIFPASMTKVATAYYVLEKINNLEQKIIPSSHALRIVRSKEKQTSTYPPYILEYGGSSLKSLKANHSYLLKDLIFAILLCSANDAANVVAESVSGSIPKFMSEVNFFLKDLGCKNTHFSNPHGLHVPDHYSTAFDLALLTQNAMKNKTFRDIVAREKYQFSSKKEEITQTNRLVKPGVFNYPKAFGVKTGYTSKAGYNLIATAEDENRSLLLVLTGVEKDRLRFEEGIRLFENAFSEKKIEEKLFDTNHLFSKHLKGATSPLEARLKSDLTLSFFASEKPNPKAYIYWDELSFPIQKEQKVGSLVLLDNQALLAKVDLIASKEVKKTFLQRVKNFFIR